MTGEPVLHHFSDDRAVAVGLAVALGVPAAEIALHHFPDGESLPRVAPPGQTAILYCSLDHPDAKLLPLMLAADALRRGGAKRIVLVAPYLPYMRQDAVFTPGEPVSQQVMARLLKTSSDRVVTVDAHLHRTRDLAALFAPAEGDNLASTPALAEWIGSAGPKPEVVVGPDEESEPWVRSVAGMIGADWLTMAKRRHGDREVEVSLAHPDAVAGRRVLIVDDICSSGGTLRQAIRVLSSAGAASVGAYVTHALFDDAVGRSLRDAGASVIVSSDSIRHPSNAIRLREVLAAALRVEVDPSGRSGVPPATSHG